MHDAASEAARLLGPVLRSVHAGAIDWHDQLRLAVAVTRLPQRPSAPLLDAFDTALMGQVEHWERHTPDPEYLTALVSGAFTNLAAARLSGDAELQSNTLLTAARVLRHYFELYGALTDLDLVIVLLREALTLPLSADARPVFLGNLAATLCNRYELQGEPADLDESLSLLEEALSSAPASRRAGLLNTLGVALQHRYEQDASLQTLDRQTKALREAVALSPSDDPRRVVNLSNLSIALSSRYALDHDPEVLDEQEGVLREALDLPASEAYRPILIAEYASVYQQRYRLQGEATFLDEAVRLLTEAVELTPGGPRRPVLLTNLGNMLTERYEVRGEPADLDVAVHVLTEAADGAQAEHMRAGALRGLAGALGARYFLRGDPADLAERMRLLEEVLSLTPAGPSRSRVLNDLGLALDDRYAWSGDPADLDREIQLLEEAIRLSGPGPRPPDQLNNLGKALVARYAWAGDLADLEAGLLLLEEAVQRSPTDRDRAWHAHNLGRALADRYARNGDPADLERLLALHTEAVRLTSSTAGPFRPLYLSGLARAHAHRYRQDGREEDLHEAIRLHQEALELTPGGPNRAARLVDLGNVLGERYQLLGDPHDLDEELRLLQEAITLTPRGSDRAGYLNDLGIALAERYHRYGNPTDLDRQVDLLQEAVRLDDEDESTITDMSTTIAGTDATTAAAEAAVLGRAGRLNNLAAALADRYRMRGDPGDLEERLGLLERAIRLTAAGPDRPGYLNNKAGALLERYILHGNLADLDTSIETLEEAVRLTPAGPERPSRLANLGIALSIRYDLRADPRDLDKWIDLLEEAVKLTPAGPDRPSWLSNLGLALGDRYVRLGNAADVDRQVSLLEEAIGLTPSGPARVEALSGLAAALRNRYHLRRDPDDVNAVVRYLEEAVRLTPTGTNRPGLLNNLRLALSDRYALYGNPIDLMAQVRLLEEAVSLVGTRELPAQAGALGQLRLRLAEATRGAARREHLVAAARALETGAAALERMLVTTVERDEEALLRLYGTLYDWLVAAELGLAEDAATVDDRAGTEGHKRRAYRAAERGKGRRAAALLATPALHPASETPEVQKLLEEIARLRRELALLDRQLAAGTAPPGPPTMDTDAPRGGWHGDASALTLASSAPLRGSGTGAGTPALSPEARAALSQRAEQMWAQLRQALNAIAATDPNYANVRGFAEPQPPAAVVAALPPGGTLVLLYPLDDALACFVLRRAPDGAAPVIQAVNVPIHAEDSKTKTQLAGKAALTALVEQALAPTASGTPAVRPLDHVLDTLGRALHPALAPLLPPPDPDNPPALVLVPTGPLHRLPLHALPWPTLDHGQRLLDGYTVSYATSADVLPLAADKPAAPAGVAALAPGLPPERPLPGALAEASHLAALGGGVPRLRAHATRAALLDERVAAGARWALIATHGRAGGGDASRAGLLLYDDDGAAPDWLTAAEILTLLPLDGVEHLGLGACSTHADTATAGDRLAGLLRALLYRGARSVQATLWPVRDDAAALVSAWTWEALLAGETNKAAALRAAVQRLRRCSGREATSELRRIAADLATMLPADDPAHGQLETLAQRLENQGRPFLRSPDWTPFVLHGAPCTAAHTS